MKKTILPALLFGLFMVSCTTDDAGDDIASANNYLELNAGNYWAYDITGTTLSGRDSLYVANDTVIDGNGYKKLKARAISTGFYSTTLHNNSVRKLNSSLVMSGSTGLNLGAVLPVNIVLDDFIIFRENADAGAQLSLLTDTSTQTFEGYPLNLEYSLKTVAGETLATYSSPNGDSYSDVKSVTLTLNIAISTTINVLGFDVDIPIMNSQDVITSTHYYAKNIGMVYANTTISYDLEDFSQAGFELPIPDSGSDTQEEFLDIYVSE